MTNSIKIKHDVNTPDINAVVTIRLNDECKNGYQDFAITATFWEVGKMRTDRYMITGGACHDEILRHFPQFEIFVKLHLCDFLGRPMYAVENGFYHLFKMDADKFCKYYGISAEKYSVLKLSQSKNAYYCNLVTLGILNDWAELAQKGIAEIEKLAGVKFQCDSVRTNISSEYCDNTDLQKFISNNY